MNNISPNEGNSMNEKILLISRPSRPDKEIYRYDHECMPRDECIVLTFGPGNVRYLRGCDLFHDNYKKLIVEIEEIGTPLLKLPPELALIYTKGPGDSWDDYQNYRLNPYLFEILVEEADFKRQLGLITFIVKDYRDSLFSQEAYWAFSKSLGLKKLAINEFRKSLLEIEYVDRISYAETINSYLGSSDHEIINGNVFIKTKFWRDSVRELENFLENEKQLEIAQALEALRIESAQKLLESGYSVYVYLMEDTRNGLFKIGKSNNPLKRERTLQSEVPTTYLRFALPCEESMESELHQRYSSFRKRGEWFEIDSSMLFDLVTELLSKGDATRILGEREWLGEMLIRRFHKT